MLSARRNEFHPAVALALFLAFLVSLAYACADESQKGPPDGSFTILVGRDAGITTKQGY